MGYNNFEVTPKDIIDLASPDAFALFFSILRTSAEQLAREEAPKILDPIQQAIAIQLRSYLNHPKINRKDVVAALQRINIPQPRVDVKLLKKAYETFTSNGQISELMDVIMKIGEHAEERESKQVKQTLLKRDDLKLVCFEYVW